MKSPNGDIPQDKSAVHVGNKGELLDQVKVNKFVSECQVEISKTAKSFHQSLPTRESGIVEFTNPYTSIGSDKNTPKDTSPQVVYPKHFDSNIYK
jgi:propanediol utilization protein